MIINGGQRRQGTWFTNHLTKDEENESVRLVEMRGLAAENIAGAFREMKAIGSGTRCKDYFYHANINILAHESLTPEQWEKAVDTLEENLGLKGQARFVVEHVKKGRIHQHIIWSRIDVDKMIGINMGKDFFGHQRTARQLEIEFNLERGVSVLGPGKGKDRPKRRPKNADVFRGKQHGIDVFAMQKEITGLWNSTGTGKEFVAALDEKGYVLVEGNRRVFCVVDQAGDVHSLARRIDGAKAADIKIRLADIDKKTLPSIDQAKEYQRGRFPQQGGQNMPDAEREEEKKKEADRQDEQWREAVEKEQDRITQSVKDEEDRKAGIIKDQEQKAEQQQAEQKKADELKQEQQFKEKADRQVEQARELEQAELAERDRFETFKAEKTREAEEGKKQDAERAARAKEGEITNAQYRYGQALGNNYDIRDPYGSLARSAMAEYGSFMRERQNLDRQIATTDDPQKRQALELRKQIEAAEYMEITSNRIANQSEIIVGERNTPEAKKQRQEAARFREEAKSLRMEYREVQAARGDEKADASKLKPMPPQQEKEASKEKAPEAKEQGKQTESREAWHGELKGRDMPNIHDMRTAAHDKRQDEGKEKTTKPPLMVEERAQGKPKGAPQKLTDYVKTLPEKPAPREYTKEEIRNNPVAKREHYSKLLDEQTRSAALDQIGRDYKAGQNLNSKDIRNLNRDDLKNIKSQGDDYIKIILQQHDRTREQGRER